MELCAFAGKAEGDEGGGDLRRRSESVARDFEDEFWARVELREDGQIAVVARAGLRGEATRDFGLDDDVNFVDEAREREEVVEDGRGDEVGKIAVDADASAGGDGGEVGFENVAGNDGEIREFLREAAKARDESGVEFDGVDGSARGEEVFGQFTVAGADFDPAVLIVPMNRGSQTTLVAREGKHGMRRNADGARDLFAPVEVFQEMLAEALTCHGWNSVARGASSERLKV